MVYAEESRSVNLDALASKIHILNAKWWQDLDGKAIKRDVGTMLMLMVSEAGEAMEGRRKSKPGAPMMDDHLPHREMAEVELADIQIRALDILGSGQFRSETSDDMTIEQQVEFAHRQNSYYNTLHHLEDGDKLFMICQIICNAGSNYLMSGTLFRSLCRVVAAVEVLADIWGYDLYAAVEEKNEYNKVRHDHSIEGRKAEGGKAW